MKQMSRPEFEAYEKRIETLLSGFEANIEPWERHDYDQIAAATRGVVNIRREYLEQNERQAQTTAPARRGAGREAWGGAIGKQVVARGNDAMFEVVTTRDRAAHDGQYPGNAEAGLRPEGAARATIADNSWLKAVAERDQDLLKATAKEERGDIHVVSDTADANENWDRMEGRASSQSASRVVPAARVGPRPGKRVPGARPIC